MKEILELFLVIRHLKPDDIKKRVKAHHEALKHDYPHDETFGKYMREELEINTEVK